MDIDKCYEELSSLPILDSNDLEFKAVSNLDHIYIPNPLGYGDYRNMLLDAVYNPNETLLDKILNFLFHSTIWLLLSVIIYIGESND